MKKLTGLLGFILLFNIVPTQNANAFFHFRTLFKLKKIMGAPPKKGSVEEAVDFVTMLDIQNTRTEEDCAIAAKEVKVSLESFFGGENGPLSPSEVKRLKPFFYKHSVGGGLASYIGKLLYKRPRPFIANTEIVPCIKKATSYSYPSGHATLSRVLAYALAKKFPERAEMFMIRADEVAQNRVIGGVHHPTDIVAGKKLADALAKKLFTKKFMRDLRAM